MRQIDFKDIPIGDKFILKSCCWKKETETTARIMGANKAQSIESDAAVGHVQEEGFAPGYGPEDAQEGREADVIGSADTGKDEE